MHYAEDIIYCLYSRKLKKEGVEYLTKVAKLCTNCALRMVAIGCSCVVRWHLVS